MKPKNLVPLAVILAILAGLVFLRQSQQQPASLIEQVQLQPLLPDGLETTDIARIELYAGTGSEEPVVLERDEGVKWKISSHFDAPVLQDRVDELVEMLVGLKGEYRATTSGDGLTDYKLQDDQCFHVLGYRANADQPLFHILAGKGPTLGNAFARAADSDDVYLIDVNLRRQAGIYTLKLTDQPKADAWFYKRIFDFELDKVRKVALNYPDKSFTFDYQKFEVLAEPDPEAEDTEEDAEPELVEEWRWVMTEGGIGEELSENALSNLTRRLVGLGARDVVDPATKSLWALDPPQYTCRLTLEGQADELVIHAGVPAGQRHGYIHVVSADKDRVYQINGYDFEQLFALGSDYFELPGLLVDESDVDRIEYTMEDSKVVLTKGEDGWVVSEPSTDIAPIASEIEYLVRSVLAWKAIDYADSAEGTGLDAPGKVVTFSGSEVSHTISIGDRSASGRYVYAKLDGVDLTLAMAVSGVSDIFVAPKDLFEAALFPDVEATGITALEIVRDGQTIVLASSEGEWTASLNGETFDADPTALDALLSAVSLLKADDFAFDPSRAQGATLGSISFTTEAGEQRQLNAEVEQDGLYPVTVAGKSSAYLVNETSIDSVFLDAESLKTVEADAEESAAPDAEQ